MNNFITFLHNNKSLLKLFTPYILKRSLDKFLIISSLVLVIGNIILSAYLPFLFGELIDKITNRGEYLLSAFLIYGTLWAINSISIQLRAMLSWGPLRRGMKEFFRDFFEHIIHLPLDFHSKNNIGKLVTVFNKVEFSLNTYFWHTYYYIFPLILEVLLIGTFIYYAASLHYTIFLFVGICLFVFITIYFSKNDSLLLEEANESLNALGGKITDKFYNIELIKCFNKYKSESQEIANLLSERQRKSLKTDLHFEKVFLLQNLVLGGILLVFIITSYLDYYHNKVELAVLVMLNTYVIRIATPLSYLGYVLREIKHSSTHIKEVLHILQIPYKYSLVSKKKLNGYEIEFRNVSVVKDDKIILNEINLIIKEGETIGIVGSSGSGKSTIVKLIAGLDKNYKGHILVGGKELKTIPEDYYNSLFSIATQENKLFNETLLYNITYGNPNPSTEQINKIIEYSLEDIISRLEKKLQTNVNQQGVNFSGGEKQRIAIARALMKNASIYLFDEITSSLDSKNSNLIYANIINKFPNSTKIFISHQEMIVEKCTRVYFINKNKIEDVGTHAYLLKNNNNYKKVWNIKSDKN